MNKQLPLSLGHRVALGDSDFLVAPCNKDAVAWIDRWPDWPSPMLVVYGPAQCGKTHLAHVWQARSDAMLVKPGVIGENAYPGLSSNVPNCVIDDVSESVDERALLYLHNTLKETGGYLLITSRKPPIRWHFELADLGSRMRASPTVSVRQPDDELISALLIKLFTDRQLHVGADVIGFLVTRIERSFSGANQIVALLDEAALASHRGITIPLAREIIRNLEKKGN